MADLCLKSARPFLQLSGSWVTALATLTAFSLVYVLCMLSSFIGERGTQLYLCALFPNYNKVHITFSAYSGLSAGECEEHY